MSRFMSAKDHPNNAPGVPMVYPPAFERLQIKYMNPMVKRIARRHARRRQGSSIGVASPGRPTKPWSPPFRKGNTLAIALGHGKTDSVKNVLAAEGGG